MCITVELSEGEGLDFKELKKDRGYLVYIARTYWSMVPYLKGIHQTLDSWRSGRNTDGWKLSLEKLREYYAEDGHEIGGNTEAPAKVQAVPHLKSEQFAMGELLVGDKPYKVPVRVRSNCWVRYGMGDASGEGFGARFHINGALLFRYGQWASAISEASSNYMERRNLVETI